MIGHLHPIIGDLLPQTARPACTSFAAPPQSTAPNFSNYDDSGAWPYLLDEFVELMRKQQQQAADGVGGT